MYLQGNDKECDYEEILSKADVAITISVKLCKEVGVLHINCRLAPTCYDPSDCEPWSVGVA